MSELTTAPSCCRPLADGSPSPSESRPGRMCAIIHNTDHVLAWNCLDNLSVLCRADRVNPGRDEWTFAIQGAGGDVWMRGVIFGGISRAICVMRSLRNALTGRAMRRRRQHAAARAGVRGGAPSHSDPAPSPKGGAK